MRQLFFFLAFITFIPAGGVTQNNVEKYYHYVNKAELALCDSNYESADKFYKKAFKQNIPFSKDVINAYRLHYIFLKNDKQTVKYAFLLAKRSYDPCKIFLSDSVHNPDLKDRIRTIQEAVQDEIIPGLRDSLKQMMHRDQAIRKSGYAYIDSCKYKAKYIDFH